MNNSSTNGTIVSKTPYIFPEDVQASDFPYLEEVEASEIFYLSDGLKVKGFYIRPKRGGPHPCVIYNRGGNREFGAIVGKTVASLLCRIASWGYIVVASQYRGNDGGEGREEFGGADINDVLNLFQLLDKDPQADSSRIGMYGGSRGGMMTCLALAKTDRVKAAVIRCGASDLTDWKEDRSDMVEVYRDLIPGFDEDPEGTLVARSAVYWPERLCKTTPILIMHGTADWRVNPKSSLKLAEGLLKTRHPFRLVLLEGADHALSEFLEERNRLTKDWLDRYVKNGEPLPNLEPHGD